MPESRIAFCVFAVLTLIALIVLQGLKRIPEKGAWRYLFRFMTCVGVLPLLANLLPLDWLIHPPLSGMIEIPSDAELISVYRVEGARKGSPIARVAFRNPWEGFHQTDRPYPYPWYKRRGFDERIMLRQFGPLQPELESLAVDYSRGYNICVFEDRAEIRAVVIDRVTDYASQFYGLDLS
ncbi:MAG: hypothetical protein AAGB46_17125 [Verrucomicrobiota bacterium]